MKKLTALILTVVMIFSLMSVTTLATTGYTVTVAPVTNGTVDVSQTSANANDSLTITVTPAENYALKTNSVKVTYVDGETKTADVLQDSETEFSFEMPAANVTVSAVFLPIPEVNAYSGQKIYDGIPMGPMTDDENTTYINVY